MQFVDLPKQYKTMKKAIDAAVAETLEQAIFIQGKSVQTLEAELCTYTNASNCISCANGTDAIKIVLMALGVGPGDAVFTTNFSFIGTAEPIALLGATPIFCDIDPLTFNLSVSELKHAILRVQTETKLNVKAIIAVDIFGNPSNYTELRKVAQEHSMSLISDAAQSFGAEYHKQKTGNTCDITTTSFFPAKPLGCYGDGGAIFCADTNLANTMRSIAHHGKGEHKYDHTRIGVNSRLDSIQAAVLSVKLPMLNNELSRRNAIAEHLSNACLYKGLQSQTITSNSTSAYAQFSIVAPKERESIITNLYKQKIPTQVYYPSPLSSFNIWQSSPDIPTPVTYNLCENIFSVPVHPYLSDSEVELIAQALKSL